jgi:hypothetical protein
LSKYPKEEASLETSKFSLYFSGCCKPTNESLLILLALPTLAQTILNLGTGHKVTARVGRSDLGWAMENQSLGSFDGPPIFLYVHGWATKQKPISTFSLIMTNIIANKILKSNIIQM